MNERGTGRRKAAGKGRRSDRLEHIGAALRGMAVPIAALTGDEHNARRHSRRNLDAIAASLERFGQQVPVVFAVRDRKKVVVKGNGLLIAARQLGWRYLAAVRSTLTARELRAFAIADNRTSDLSEFDAELLAAQLQELEETDFDRWMTSLEAKVGNDPDRLAAEVKRRLKI